MDKQKIILADIDKWANRYGNNSNVDTEDTTGTATDKELLNTIDVWAETQINDYDTKNLKSQ